MEIKAKTKYIRMSPRKVRLVTDIIRGMETNNALDVLKITNKRAVKPVEKLIKAGIANADHNFGLNKDNLYIKEIRVNEGPTLHRWMPRAYGRATPIRKRTSHINLILAEVKEGKETVQKKKKIEAPIKLEERPRQAEKEEKIGKEKKESSIEKITKKEEKDKEIIDIRREGRGGHERIEGSTHKGKGFISKIFRRKSG